MACYNIKFCKDGVTPRPCGYCIFCRMALARDYSLRALHESTTALSSYFITLTFSKDNCPVAISKRDLQLFFKRLRHHTDFTYLACGEYGEDYSRPHYHVILFNPDLESSIFRNQYGYPQSELLDKAWPLGFHTIDIFTTGRAQYVSQYTLKKFTDLSERISDIDFTTGEIKQKPFQLLSPLGRSWFLSNWTDLLKGYVTYGSVKYRIPRFYLDLLYELTLPLCEKGRSYLYPLRSSISSSQRDRIKSFFSDRELKARSAVYDFEDVLRNAEARLINLQDFIRSGTLSRDGKSHSLSSEFGRLGYLRSLHRYLLSSDLLKFQSRLTSYETSLRNLALNKRLV